MPLSLCSAGFAAKGMRPPTTPIGEQEDHAISQIRAEQYYRAIFEQANGVWAFGRWGVWAWLPRSHAPTLQRSHAPNGSWEKTHEHDQEQHRRAGLEPDRRV